MYCRNCGTKLDSDDLFCQECGTPQRKERNDSRQTRFEENPIQNSSRDRGQGIQKKKKRIQRKRVIPLVATILIIVMGITVAVKLLPFGNKAKQGELEQAEDLLVSYDNPRVSLAGIDVDVNALNLTDGDKLLTVEKYKESRGEDGFLGMEYEISLGEEHYLRAPLTITISYDEKLANDHIVTLLHFDQDEDAWIPLDTEIDPSENTVTGKLTSLSPVRMVYFNKEYAGALYYIENSGHSNAMMKVSYNYWDEIKNTSQEPARIIAQDYIIHGNTLSSTEQMIQAGDDAINTLNTYYTLFGAFGDTVMSSISLLAPAGGALQKTTGLASRDLGILSLLIASTQLMFDLQTKDSTGPQNETALNLYKNIATNMGTLYSFCTGYSSAAFSAGFFAVAVTGFVLDTLIAEAKTIQADTVEAIFETYYEEYSGFSEKDWYNIFVDAYWDAWQNNRETEEGMNYALNQVTDAINTHGEKFWTEIYKEGSDALTFAVADAGENNYFTPTADQKAELTADFKVDLFQRFNKKVMPWINEFMQERMKSGVYSSLLKAAEPFNRYYTVQIQEIAPQDRGDVCRFQKCPIRFGSNQGFIDAQYLEEWELQAPEDDDEWAVKKDFTLMGYIMAGAPDSVMIFDAKDKEMDFGKQIREEKLVLSGDENNLMTVIDLSQNDQGISGMYDVTGTETTYLSGLNIEGDFVEADPIIEEVSPFLAKVEQNKEVMVITLQITNNTDYHKVLTGTFNEATQTFIGKDLSQADENSGGNGTADKETTIIFDLSSTPIKAKGSLYFSDASYDEFTGYTIWAITMTEVIK